MLYPGAGQWQEKPCHRFVSPAFIQPMRNLGPLLCVLLCGGLHELSGQENLITNPGFEGGSISNGLPAGGWWWFQGLGETEAKLERASGHQGKGSVSFHSEQPSKG